jgi:DNA repair photolyase
MIIEIQAKTLLSHSKQPDPWFGIKYGMNIYRGCEHQCIYCDSRSECYQIENFKNVLVKVNALELLEKELPRKRTRGTIGTGSMSDPYTPTEKRYNLTGRALEIIARHGFPLHAITKSDLVVRDLEALRQINRALAVVSFTLTTVDDELARKVEPGAPLPSARLRAMAALADAGIHTGVTLMPVLPFIEDTTENILSIVRRAREHGASYLIPGFGMTLRDRQRSYYYDQLDRLFPDLRHQYEKRFGDRYSADARNTAQLDQVFRAECARLGLSTSVPKYEPAAEQPPLFT